MKVLAQGSKGINVTNLQRALNGFFNQKRLVPDGDFGPMTDKAVREYQKSIGLIVDGMVGLNTAARLGLKESSGRASSFKFDSLQHAARDRSELVYVMEQGHSAVLSQPGPWGPIQDGFCAGLAMRWVGLRHRGKDYAFDAETLEVTDNLWQASRDQNLSRDEEGGFLARVEKTMRQYGVSVNRARYQKSTQGVTVGRIENAIFAGRGLYYIELRRNGGAHAIAIQREESAYRLFDSNEGHFFLRGLDRFKEFLQEFLVQTGYGRWYVAGTWIVGVN